MSTSNSLITFRRHDLDNLRTALTGLVIFHHTAISYGGEGQGWRSRLVPFTVGKSSLPLAVFTAYNQTFFMGLFFWLSGHFSAQSLAKHDKKSGSRWIFVKDKLKRLALPAVVYTLVVMPAIKVVVLPEWTASAVTSCLSTHFTTVRGVQGASWYLATLFAFDMAAACVAPRQDALSENKASKTPAERDSLYANLGRYAWIPITAATFFIRMKFPVGQTTRPLGLQLAYALQYVFAYSMGHLSVSRGQQWLSGPLAQGCETQDGKESRMGFTSASLLCCATLTLVLLPSFLRTGTDWIGRAVRQSSGGWNLTAGAYAIWNELSFSIVGPALMVLFYKRYNKTMASNLWKPRYSYAAFLVHDLVVVAVETTLDTMLIRSGSTPEWVNSGLWKMVGPVLMTIISGTLNSVVSFTVAKMLIDNVSWLGRFI